MRPRRIEANLKEAYVEWVAPAVPISPCRLATQLDQLIIGRRRQTVGAARAGAPRCDVTRCDASQRYTLLALARRIPYTKVLRQGQERPAHVKGKSDVVYCRFQCFAPECTETLVVLESECGPGFDISCPRCGYRHVDGGTGWRFLAEVVNLKTEEVLASANFELAHADYIALAERVKYCILCYALLPLAAFDYHDGRKRSGRQGECGMCKRSYNDIKNHTRLVEQHREAADNRRLLRVLSGEGGSGQRKLSVDRLLATFDRQCFNCERELQPTPGGEDGYYLDHTLPVTWLWPLDHGPTVLCRVCNARKADKWPALFYSDGQLRSLSTRTGIPYEVLKGEPFFNPEAIQRLRHENDKVIERWAAYPDRLRTLRNRVLARTGEDVFQGASANARRSIGIVDDP